MYNMHNHYKTLLCKHLNNVGRYDVALKSDNDWLDFFRSFARRYLLCKDEEAADEAALIEIRFIELVCRFVYRLSHSDAKLQIFDEFSSAIEMCAALSYVNDLTADDVCKIETVMDSIRSMGTFDVYGLSDFWYTFTRIRVSSVEDDYVYIPNINGQVRMSPRDEKEKLYLGRFIWSLSSEGRVVLLDYYRYCYFCPDSLRKIYDGDRIIDEILRNILHLQIDENYRQYDAGEKYEKRHFDKKEDEDCNKIYIYGGYHNQETIIYDNYEKEIPAYYVENIFDVQEKEIIRPVFLREKARDFPTAYPCFALVDEGCLYDDYSKSKVIPLSFRIEYEGANAFPYTYGLEAEQRWHADEWLIRVRVNGTYYVQSLTSKSAYMFRYAAKSFLREIVRDDEFRKYFEENYYEGIDLDSIADPEIRQKKLARKEADEKAYSKMACLFFLSSEDKRVLNEELKRVPEFCFFDDLLNEYCKFSDAELCRRTGITKSTLSRMRSGKIKQPDRNNLWAIAIALELSLDVTEKFFNSFGMTIHSIPIVPPSEREKYSKRELLIQKCIEMKKWGDIDDALSYFGFEQVYGMSIEIFR